MADTIKAITKVLSPVAGYQYRAPISRKVLKPVLEFGPQCWLLKLAYYFQQGIDHCIAGNENAGRVDAFAQQIFVRGGGRGEVECGQRTGQAPVAFFRPR
ncbi:hypothetical protein D3C79_1031240 [compost metagenome]